MKNQRLLHAFGQIDDRYIVEATSFSRKGMRFKPMLIAAILCICVSGITALAATGALQGFFADILNRNGAVVGTSYEQASGEMELQVMEAADSLALEVRMVAPDKISFREIEAIGLGSYEIVAENGESVAKGDSTDMAAVVNGKAMIHIALEDIPAGNYRLLVNEMLGEKKADQPLILRGRWECRFVR